MDTALIMDIKHFAVHDGDGIRTTVFFKGCPLNCCWCHNPEGLTMCPTLAYVEKNCISCGECVTVCPAGAHTFLNGHHAYNRSICGNCGRCAQACLGNALKLYGQKMTVRDLMPILLADRSFYENSNGGVTLSGGECLLQYEFCASLLKSLKAEGIHTAVDTCGYVQKEALDAVLPYTDVFLYDLKAIDDQKHIKATGCSNRLILDNLFYLDNRGASLEIRIPYVPDYNNDEIHDMAELLIGLKHLIKIRLLPFHNLAVSKYASMGLACFMPERLPTKEALCEARAIFRAKGLPLFD